MNLYLSGWGNIEPYVCMYVCILRSTYKQSSQYLQRVIVYAQEAGLDFLTIEYENYTKNKVVVDNGSLRAIVVFSEKRSRQGTFCPARCTPPMLRDWENGCVRGGAGTHGMFWWFEVQEGSRLRWLATQPPIYSPCR